MLALVFILFEITMQLHLTNHAWVTLALSNEFKPNLTRELEDCLDDKSRLACINANSKYRKGWELEYSSNTKNVYKIQDSFGNINYLICRFK